MYNPAICYASMVFSTPQLFLEIHISPTKQLIYIEVSARQWYNRGRETRAPGAGSTRAAAAHTPQESTMEGRIL